MNILRLSFIALLLIFLASCGDDEESTATLDIATQISVNGDSFTPGNQYTVNGDVVQFDIVKFYMGGLTATTSSETVDRGDDLYILVEESNATTPNAISLSDVSTLNTFSFFIGVSPEINTQDEATYLSRPEEDPLSIKDVPMHWNWNTGYRFVRIDGQVDTDGDGVVDAPIAYHLGTEAMRIGITYSPERALVEGSNTLLFDFDLGLLFTGIDISENTTTHTGNNLPLAQQVRDNIPSALRLAQ
jgi:hypothetical protein